MGRDVVVELPDEIRLTLDEVAVVMGALDVAESCVVADSGEERQVRAAIGLLVNKLWPELDDLAEE